MISPFLLVAAPDLLAAALEATAIRRHNPDCASHHEHACSCWVGRMTHAIDRASGNTARRCPVCLNHACGGTNEKHAR